MNDLGAMSDIDKDRKGHRRLENSGGGLLPAMEGHSLGHNRIETAFFRERERQTDRQTEKQGGLRPAVEGHSQQRTEQTPDVTDKNADVKLGMCPANH